MLYIYMFYIWAADIFAILSFSEIQ